MVSINHQNNRIILCKTLTATVRLAHLSRKAIVTSWSKSVLKDNSFSISLPFIFSTLLMPKKTMELKEFVFL